MKVIEIDVGPGGRETIITQDGFPKGEGCKASEVFQQLIGNKVVENVEEVGGGCCGQGAPAPMR